VEQETSGEAWDGLVSAVPSPADRLLDAAQVAELLNEPTSWVREHTRSGAIPHVPLGRYVRYVEADVLAWLEGRKAGG
jgi:excisionase family DNA binding protein